MYLNTHIVQNKEAGTDNRVSLSELVINNSCHDPSSKDNFHDHAENKQV